MHPSRRRRSPATPFFAATALFSFAAVVWSPSARADMPNPDDDDCTVAEQCSGTGVECAYARNDRDAGESTCVRDAKAKGLVVLCSRGGGTVGNDIYCPAGTKRSGSGCLVSSTRSDVSSNAAPFAIAGALAFAIVGMRRRAKR